MNFILKPIVLLDQLISHCPLVHKGFVQLVILLLEATDTFGCGLVLNFPCGNYFLSKLLIFVDQLVPAAFQFMDLIAILMELLVMPNGKLSIFLFNFI